MAGNYGFELVWSREIKELQSRARLYRYVSNGAEVLSVENDDENKVFGATFRTPPRDSTGVAHILEHSVLCGSRKYPLKEPFVELLKGSLQTFLNAMTFPDKTCYPVASQNARDFYNLIDVYLDAIFYPRLGRDVFDQEGWHFELDSEDDDLRIKGVVYNEMKGAYSSPDGLLAEYSQQSLFPDTSYGLDSGGDPQRIPDLAYEDFEEFHRTFYHPSNVRFFFYGDDDPEQRLRTLHEYLRDFGPMEVDSGVGRQPGFASPVRMERSYVAEEESGAKPMVTVNWMLGETTDVDLNLAMQVLEYLLAEMPASPLRKRLLESGLGEDLAGVGLETDVRQMFFSIGMKGVVSNEALTQVEQLIQDTMAELAENGFDPRTVEAALNSVEFELRENNTGAMPRGLVVMIRALESWLYDSDPTMHLAFEEPLERLKERIRAGEPVFENMLRHFFLDNTHRSTLFLRPDPEMAARLEERERAKIREAEIGMSPEQRQRIVERTRELKRKQEAPDDPDALARIPRLRLEDLPREEPRIPLEVADAQGASLVYHDLSTNGILYLDVGMDLGLLEQKHLGFVPLFGRALLEMGTEEQDYVSLSQRIQAKTGGLTPDTFTSQASVDTGGGACAWLFLRGKAMQHQVRDLADILVDVLTGARFDDPERFRQIVLEEKARQEQKLIPAGHRVVNVRLRSKLSLSDWVAEHMGGISYLLFLRYVAAEIDRDWSRIRQTLETMRGILVNGNAMVVNATLDADNWGRQEPVIREMLSRLPGGEAKRAAWRTDVRAENEGLTLPAQVNYVGKGLDLYEQGYSFHGSSLVVTRYLRTSWLWDKIRVQGGAYGAFSLFDRFSGVFSFVSYRDPNLAETLRVYDETASFLKEADLDESEIEKAIIGTIGDMDRYMLPDAKGMTSLARWLVGDTREKRQRMREEILSTSREDFRRFGEYLESCRDRGIVTVLGDRSRMEDPGSGIGLDHVWRVL
jgi:hypothetical protein